MNRLFVRTPKREGKLQKTGEQNVKSVALRYGFLAACLNLALMTLEQSGSTSTAVTAHEVKHIVTQVDINPKRV